MPISTINTNSIADDAVTVPKVTDQVLTHRNLIINGAMQVAQRGTSASVSGTGFSYNAVDRMKVGRSNVDQIVTTVSQSTDVPDSFAYSHKVDVTTAESAIASDEYYRGLQYAFEGQDLTALAYGASGAKSVTLSFWVKSSKTGTYAISLYKDESTDRIYSTSYTVDSAGVWEYKTVTVEGDTSSGITNDNAARLVLSYYLMAGSNYTGGDIDGWEDYSSTSDLAAPHTVSWGTSTSDYWQITGLQMEVGDTATPFEHRSYGDELARCQRYYETFSGRVCGYTESFLRDCLPFKVTKRAAPTVTESNSANSSGNSVTLGVNSTLNAWTFIASLSSYGFQSDLTADAEL